MFKFLVLQPEQTFFVHFCLENELKPNLGVTSMEWQLILKTSFFLLWPLLLMGAIILSKKYRKNKGSGKSLWHH